MAGRKRKPSKLHLIQGTARPCRTNKKEPKAPEDVPRPAVDLDSRSAFWYGILVGRIQSLNVGSSADSESVMLAARRLAEIEECDKNIDEFGMVYKHNDLIKANPAVGQRSEAARHLQSLLSEFGLSPASRAKVSANDTKRESVNPFEAFR
jgi:P27 family predicted phage terminase small subunit